MIIVKGYWAYIIGIPFQLMMFFLALFLVGVLQHRIDVFDTVDVKDKTYHLVQVSSSLYLFECDGETCAFNYIDGLDSSFFSQGHMIYFYSNDTFYVEIKAHGDEEYIIPLTEN